MYTEKQGRPKANWTNCSPLGPAFLDYLLSAVQVHTTIHCRFYREQHWTTHLLRSAMLRSTPFLMKGKNA